tara:strand:+ start:134 stop:655 length:522 start_codon:yes stop_codon:yes gene_type:complete
MHHYMKNRRQPKVQTMIVTLNQVEQELAKTVGIKRHQQNLANGTNLSAKSDPDNDINGFAGELVVARVINGYPDFSIGPHRRGFDLKMRDYNKNDVRIDVKTTRKQDGYLISKKWRKVDDCDMYVLVSGSMPRYEIQGWVWSVELVNPSNLSDNGYGEHYHMERSQLRAWKYA